MKMTVRSNITCRLCAVLVNLMTHENDDGDDFDNGADNNYYDDNDDEMMTMMVMMACGWNQNH